MRSKGLHVTTPNDTSIVMTRTFDAPRRLVWEAMTTPDKMRRWMLPPPGWTASRLECDARVGGALKVAWKSDEADPVMTLEGVFTEVILHEKMVHTETMKLGTGQVIGSLIETHEFAEVDGITTMRITQVYESKEARDSGLADQGQGLEACYKQLDALLVQGA